MSTKGRSQKNKVGISSDIPVQQINYTNDYSIFKPLLGNRDIDDGRVAKVRKSIIENGWMMLPILVNENMEIIDGQARLTVLKELNLPVYYIIQKGLTIKECRALNVYRKDWKITDYIHSYAVNGDPDYVKIEKVIKQYGGLVPVNVIQSCYNGRNGGVTGSSKILQGHEFRVVDEKLGDVLVKKLAEASPVIKTLKGSTTRLMEAYLWLLKNKEGDFDEKLLLRKIERRDPSKVLGEAHTVEGSIFILESIYISRLSAVNKAKVDWVYAYKRWKEAVSSTMIGVHGVTK